MKVNPDDFAFCEAYFPSRVFVFGEFHEGHMSGRWIPNRPWQLIVDFARKVSEKGGLFYMDNQKYRYLVNGKCGPMILAVGYEVMSQAKAFYDLAAGSPERSGASTAEPAKGLYVAVTRKVSATGDTRTSVS